MGRTFEHGTTRLAACQTFLVPSWDDKPGRRVWIPSTCFALSCQALQQGCLTKWAQIPLKQIFLLLPLAHGEMETLKLIGVLYDSLSFILFTWFKTGSISSNSFWNPCFLSIQDKSTEARFHRKMGVSKGGGAAVIDKELLLLFSNSLGRAYASSEAHCWLVLSISTRLNLVQI